MNIPAIREMDIRQTNADDLLVIFRWLTGTLELTKRYDTYGLEKAGVENKMAFDLSACFRRDPEALGNDCNHNDDHADQCQCRCFRQLALR
jgi:hypothetical protein